MINKVLFQSMLRLCSLLFFALHQPDFLFRKMNVFNDKALVAEAKYSFIDVRDNNLFVDGKYNFKSYVDKMYDTFTPLFIRKNSINYYLMLKSGGLLKTYTQTKRE